MLLRATRVRAPACAPRDAGAYRHLFRTLKFLRLLPGRSPRRREGGGYQHRASTGRSACSRAARATACSSASPCRRSPPATAGRSRPTCAGAPSAARSASASAAAPLATAAAAPPPLPDELAAFVDRVRAPRQRLARRPGPRVLDLPGAGLCVPDLAFVRDARRRARPLRAARLLEPRSGLAPRRAGPRRPPRTGSCSRSARPARRRGGARRRRPPPRSTSSRASSPPSRSSTASSASPPRQLDLALVKSARQPMP